jgi:hypothetical protein
MPPPLINTPGIIRGHGCGVVGVEVVQILLHHQLHYKRKKT